MIFQLILAPIAPYVYEESQNLSFMAVYSKFSKTIEIDAKMSQNSAYFPLKIILNRWIPKNYFR